MFNHCSSFRITPLVLFFLSFSFSISAQLVVKTDRPNGLYEAGETVKFLITAPAWAKEPVKYSIAYDRQVKPLQEQSVSIAPGATATVSFTLREPGAVFCFATQSGYSGTAQAVFSPQLIRAAAPEPPDFDAFWNKQRALLAAVPIDAQGKPYPHSTAYSTSYRISLGMIDNRRVYGLLSVPNGPGPFPAIVQFPAFGATPIQPPNVWSDELNAIVFSLSIHNAEADAWVPNPYQPDDPTNPEKMYYRYAVLGGLRAIEYLFTRADFDRQNLCLAGESQGGALAMMVAGLDKRPKLVIGSLNALGEQAGWMYGKASAFPNYLHKANTASYGNKTAVEATMAAVQYYDPQYFARRYAGPTFTHIAYADEISPAATIFTALNATGERRTILHALRRDHSHPSEYWTARNDMIRRYLPPARKPQNPFVKPALGHFADAGPDIQTSTGATTPLRGKVWVDTTENKQFPVSWDIVSGPGSARIAHAAARNTSVVFTEPGEYLIRFTALDETLLGKQEMYFSLHDFVKVVVSPGGSADAGDTAKAQPVFRLFPNPARHTLNVEWPDERRTPTYWRLRNLSGVTALESSGDIPVIEKRWSIPLPGVPSGIYLLEVGTAEGVGTRKAVVLRD